MGHPPGPGADGATAVKPGEAAPEGDVDVLHQVAALVRVGLEGARDALDGGAVLRGRRLVAPVLLVCFGHCRSPAS